MFQRFTMTCLFWIAFSCALAFPSTGQVLLVKDGQPTAVIVTADAPTDTAKYAVTELVYHLQRATGARLEVVPESEAPSDVHTRVYIGETETASYNGIDVDRLPREAYAMKSVGNDLFIVGKESENDPLEENNPDVGTLFGVYEFIERYLGVRWLWPGDLGSYVPKSDTVELWTVDEIVPPSLDFRSIVWSRIRAVAIGGQKLSEEDERLGFSQEVAENYGQALQVLLRRHRMGGMDVKPPTGHAFSGWWKRYGKEHPEWFALRKDGTRGNPDPDSPDVPMCVSNEELQDFIVEQWDGKSVLRLGPVDRPGRCDCENCRAWDGPQPENPPWFAERMYGTDRRSQELFTGVTSDRYARFWKTIQEKAAKRNPHVVVSGSFIYENEFPAPITGIQLNKNIYAEFVQWQDPHLRWFPMPDEAFQWIKDQWIGWRETGMRMGYRPNYLHDGYVMPHFDTRQSGEFFKFAYDHGMEGARFDSLTGQWATQGLRLYLHLRLMCKPELSVDEIREEYFSAFGPAAETMEEYFDYWEDYAFDNRMRFIKLYWDVGWRYREYIKQAHIAFPPECFEPAEALLKKAMAEAGASPESEFGYRVWFIRTGLEHAKLAVKLAAIYDGNEEIPEDRVEEAKAALQELVKFRKEHENSYFSDLLHVTSFWERPRLDLDRLMED
ncbi:MAG: DUF4838 domain-containing protein [Candidatus Omnitrophica bacterium]|nr:DUF4838 domain-containing protein [Candidatus Omnitrophota bacterium]